MIDRNSFSLIIRYRSLPTPCGYPLETLRGWGYNRGRDGGKRLKSAESRDPTCIINNNLTDLPFCQVPTAHHLCFPVDTRTDKFSFKSGLHQHFRPRDNLIPGTL